MSDTGMHMVNMLITFKKGAVPDNAVSMIRVLPYAIMVDDSLSDQNLITVSCEPVRARTLARTLAMMFPGESVSW